jgi:hypothetical protein
MKCPVRWIPRNYFLHRSARCLPDNTSESLGYPSDTLFFGDEDVQIPMGNWPTKDARMNEMVLSILLSAGIVGVAVSIWLAVRYPTSTKVKEGAASGQPGEPDPITGQPKEPDPQTGQSEKPRRRLLAAAPTTKELARVPVPAALNESETPGVAILLDKAYEQLRSRQQRIESEIARIEMLRGEQDAIAAQVKALDAAIRVFSLSQASDSRMIEQARFVARANGKSLATSAAAVGQEVVHSSDEKR